MTGVGALWHVPSQPCTSPACVQCTPHTALRDHIGTDTPQHTKAFKALVLAGVTTPERLGELLAGTAEGLLALDGVGPQMVALLRRGKPEPPPQTTAAQRLAAQITGVLRRRSGDGLP